MIFINFVTRRLLAEKNALDHLAAQPVGLELGLDPLLLDRTDRDFHERLANRLAGLGKPLTVHLPFFDLQPGSVDSGVLDATRRRLRQAVEVAALYGPRRMVGHAGFATHYARSCPAWAARSADTWEHALAAWPEHPPLCLENTHEQEPGPVIEAVRALAERIGSAKAGICFDVGHWFSFAHGHRRKDLDRWLTAFGPYVKHLHLHDNDGSFDQHQGPGMADIPWDQLLAGLCALGVRPTVTFEPHTKDGIEQTLAFLDARRAEFSRLGVDVDPAIRGSTKTGAASAG